MSRPEAARPRQSLGEFALRMRVSGVVAFLVLLGLAFAALSPRFLAAQNLQVIASNAAILAIVAAAQAVVLLTRNLDVSVGAIMGFSAYLTADYAARHAGAGPEIVIPMAMALGGALGVVNGLIVAYAKVSPLVATLGTMSLYRGATYIYAHGQEVTSSRLPHWMFAAVDYRIAGLPALPMLSAVVVVLIATFLRRFPLGRQIYAVGSNSQAAVFYGLRVARVTLFAYVVAGVLCGFAGLLYAARVGTVTVVLATGWELSSLAAAVIGGVSVAGGSGTVIGAAFGALILAAIDNGLVLLRVPEFWRMFIQGSAIVAAVGVDTFIGAQIRRSLARRRLRGAPA
jgi:rhamnose transport system permease protein